MENRLELDTSVLKENKQIGESLTDLNNLHLFTDEFNLIIYKTEVKEDEKEQALQGRCFIRSELLSEDNLLKNKMFYSEQKSMVDDTQQKIDYGNYYMLLGSVFIGLVISCIVFGITDKRERMENDVDTND